MTEPAIVASPIRTYSDLHSALRDRAHDLQCTRESLDRVSGLQAGYCGKLLSRKPTRILGRETFGPMLTVLGLMLLVVEDPIAMQRFVVRLDKRRAHTNAEMRTRPNPSRSQFRGDSAWGRNLRAIRPIEDFGLNQATPRQTCRLREVGQEEPHIMTLANISALRCTTVFLDRIERHPKFRGAADLPTAIASLAAVRAGLAHLNALADDDTAAISAIDAIELVSGKPGPAHRKILQIAEIMKPFARQEH